jgi:hypothetical protein
MAIAFQNVRYFLPLIPPLCLLAVCMLYDLYDYLREFGERKKWVTLLHHLWCFPVSYTLAYYTLDALKKYRQAGFSVNTAAPAVAIVLQLILHFLFARSPLNRGISQQLALIPSLRYALIIAMLAVGLSQFGLWAANRTYDLIHVSKELALRTGDDSIVIGEAAPSLVFLGATSSKGFCVGNRVNDKIFQTSQVDYLVVQPEFLPRYHALFPEEMNRAVRVDQYAVRGTELLLFSFGEGRE